LLTNRIMFTGEVFVVLLVAVYIGWIAVAAVRSNRRRDVEPDTHHARFIQRSRRRSSPGEL